MPKVNRSWNPVETRLLAEYLASRWPGRRTIQRVRVGPLNPQLEAQTLSDGERRMTGVWRRWVDAVVFNPPEIILMEAAVRPDPGDVSQLELYLHLWPATPEYQEYRDWPTRGHLVYALEDPVIRRMARERGYTLEVFQPPWVVDYLSGLAPRNRRAVLSPSQ